MSGKCLAKEQHLATLLNLKPKPLPPESNALNVRPPHLCIALKEPWFCLTIIAGSWEVQTRLQLQQFNIMVFVNQTALHVVSSCIYSVMCIAFFSDFSG